MGLNILVTNLMLRVAEVVVVAAVANSELVNELTSVHLVPVVFVTGPVVILPMTLLLHVYHKLPISFRRCPMRTLVVQCPTRKK